jgi:predicted DCC family thiol-disulfide oxidoreductase YuxK
MIHLAAVNEPTASFPVLLFDGECGLCNRVVRSLLRLGRGARLRFAALQGPPAQEFLGRHGLPTADFDSFVFVPDWGRRDSPDFLLRTDAVIAVLRTCGGPWRVASGVLGLVPAGIRDGAYRIVARWRHRIFGPWHPGPLPRTEWRDRFIGPTPGGASSAKEPAT